MLSEPAQIWRNPKRFMMGMACDMNVSDKMMRNTAKTVLKLSSLKMQTCQRLTDLQKEKRLDRAKILLNKLKGMYGHGRDHFLWWEIVHRRGNLQPTKWPSPSKIFCRRSWFQEKSFYTPETSFRHGVGCHIQNMEISFLFGGCLVPGSFSAFLEQGGLGALIIRPEGDELFVQSLLEADACASLHGLVEAQKRSLVTVWAKMPQETLPKAAEGFRSRLKRVFQARKGHIEWNFVRMFKNVLLIILFNIL